MNWRVPFWASLIFLLAACAPQNSSKPATEVPSSFPTYTLETPQIYVPEFTPTETPAPLAGVKFVTKFSSQAADWQILPGDTTAGQINAEVARQEGNQVNRAEQKVINGFLRTVIKRDDGQVFEVLSPAELAGAKLIELKTINVKQVPVLSSYGVLLENYFALHFPNVVQKWEMQGASDADFKYAAVITISWATKYGPLHISYMTAGKYISENGKYPGRLDFLRLCMFEQTRVRFQPNGRLEANWYPEPIVGLSGKTDQGIAGEMISDAFGWTPMADFAQADNVTLNEVGNLVGGVTISSPADLAKLQAAFDKAFMPVYCAETTFD